MTVLSEFERTVVTAADKHDNNWEAVAFEVDRDPDTVQEIANAARAKLAGGNGTPASRPNVAPAPAPAPASAVSQKVCADPECSNEFKPGSGAQKYCKDDACKRRRWAREKRAQAGSKPKESKTKSPKPATPPPATAKLFRATIEVDVIFEADGPRHAVEYAKASIVDRIRRAANGDDIEVMALPDRRFEHCSAKADLTLVEILQRNGEVTLDEALGDV